MLKYPLNLSFKIIALNPQAAVTDAEGRLLFYVKQKAFALKESVKVFAEENQQNLLFSINADKIIDFSAQYNITDSNGGDIGGVKRQGMRSIWKATYHILDNTGTPVGLIHEENPWLKLLDSVLSEIPFIGMFINPSYLVETDSTPIMRLKKIPAFFESKFTLEKISSFPDEYENLIIQSIIMMMLLERIRG